MFGAKVAGDRNPWKKKITFHESFNYLPPLLRSLTYVHISFIRSTQATLAAARRTITLTADLERRCRQIWDRSMAPPLVVSVSAVVLLLTRSSTQSCPPASDELRGRHAFHNAPCNSLIPWTRLMQRAGCLNHGAEFLPSLVRFVLRCRAPTYTLHRTLLPVIYQS
jgi:hypothetical protein